MTCWRTSLKRPLTSVRCANVPGRDCAIVTSCWQGHHTATNRDFTRSATVSHPRRGLLGRRQADVPAHDLKPAGGGTLFSLERWDLKAPGCGEREATRASAVRPSASNGYDRGRHRDDPVFQPTIVCRLKDPDCSWRPLL